MGTFAATHTITYTNGINPNPEVFSVTIDDGDADTTFEVGDTYFEPTFGFTYLYQGTAVVDGETWPVFNFVGFPNVFSIFMDQAPVVIPPTLTYSAGDTFTGACFAAGTGIRTLDGDRPVETLRIGDTILTAEGGPVAVKWIGHSTYRAVLAGAKAQPVRIRAGALGAGLPERDLTVTADHGMILDGLVINASALVNGSSIAFVPLAELSEPLTVYHVETEAHDVILANGAPAESFIDYVGRAAFDNHAEYVDLYGCERLIPEMSTPRISTARLLPEAIRARLGIAMETVPLSA